LVKTVGNRPTNSPEEKDTNPGTRQQGQGELISIYINTAKNHPKGRGLTKWSGNALLISILRI